MFGQTFSIVDFLYHGHRTWKSKNRSILDSVWILNLHLEFSFCLIKKNVRKYEQKLKWSGNTCNFHSNFFCLKITKRRLMVHITIIDVIILKNSRLKIASLLYTRRRKIKQFVSELKVWFPCEFEVWYDWFGIFPKHLLPFLSQ